MRIAISSYSTANGGATCGEVTAIALDYGISVKHTFGKHCNGDFEYQYQARAAAEAELKEKVSELRRMEGTIYE